MKDILGVLVENFRDGNILIGLIIVLVGLAFNYKNIVEFFEDRKKARIKKLNEALQSEFVTGLTRVHLEQELAIEHFKITTGIRLEKQLREAIIETHQYASGELSFIHFKRALPHLFYEEKKLIMRISLTDLISYFINLIFGFVLMLLGIILIVLSRSAEGISFIQLLSAFGSGVFFIVFSLFMLYQTFSVTSARMVDKYVKLMNKEGSESKKSIEISRGQST